MEKNNGMLLHNYYRLHQARIPGSVIQRLINLANADLFAYASTLVHDHAVMYQEFAIERPEILIEKDSPLFEEMSLELPADPFDLCSNFEHFSAQWLHCIVNKSRILEDQSSRNEMIEKLERLSDGLGLDDFYLQHTLIEDLKKKFPSQARIYNNLRDPNCDSKPS